MSRPSARYAAPNANFVPVVYPYDGPGARPSTTLGTALSIVEGRSAQEDTGSQPRASCGYRAQRRWLVTLASFLFLAAANPGPALAQIDLSGTWSPIFHEDQVERVPGPDVGDYAGLPITDAGRLRGESWDASLLTLPEHQCKPHPSTYGFRGVGNLRIWSVVDDETQQVVSIRTHIQWQEQDREIFMDERESPPEFAAHTWQGFSKGHWEGNVLVVETTHLKAGWIRRNGMALSDKAKMTERFYRHGNVLTHVYIIEDPYYLSEPLIKTNGFLLNTDLTMQPYPCQSVVEVPRDEGEVPHHLPGRNPFLDDYAKKYNLPVEAMRGGAETALPEYMRKFAASGARPSGGQE